MAQAVRLNEALPFLGSGLQAQDAREIRALQDLTPTAELVMRIQEILDPYCLAMVEINPETRVKVLRGPARAELVQGGWKSSLIKVNNRAQVNSKLVVESLNSKPLFHISTGAKRMKKHNAISPEEVANRFLELALYRQPHLHDTLSGLELEYTVL